MEEETFIMNNPYYDMDSTLFTMPSSPIFYPKHHNTAHQKREAVKLRNIRKHKKHNKCYENRNQ